MTSLHQWKAPETAKMQITVEADGAERREHRRHDMEMQGIAVDRWDGSRREGTAFGQIVDLSAGGVRIRTTQTDVRADNQIRVRIELPPVAGIGPFDDTCLKCAHQSTRDCD